jgi:hypothetical protein
VAGALNLIGRYVSRPPEMLWCGIIARSSGFIRTHGEPNGETTWQLVISEYRDKEWPMKIGALPPSGFASAA